MNVLLISLQESLDTIGINYLHYYLMGNGHNSHLLHAPKFNAKDSASFNSIKDFVSDIKPGLIGFSLVSIEYHNCVVLTAFLKEHFPYIPVIWGGVHPTVNPEMSLEHADYACIGEGELPLLEAANLMEKSEPIYNVKNLCYMKDGSIVRNPLYPYIEDLDSLPSYEYVTKKGFVLEKNGVVPVNKEVLKRNTRFLGGVYHVIATRGCPFNCAYCSNNYFATLYGTRKLRRRSVGNVIAELEKVVTEYPEIAYINFQDDCFLARSEEFIAEFCEEYKKKVNRPFVARGIPKYVTENKIRMLKQAGFSWITVGLQSASERTNREVFKRKSSSEDFLKAAALVQKYMVAPFYDIIIDNPWETEEDVLDTVYTVMDTPRPFYLNIFSLTFYCGTELYDRAKAEFPDAVEDYLTKDYFLYNSKEINLIIRLAAYLKKSRTQKLLDMYKSNPDSAIFKTQLKFFRYYSGLLLEPIAIFKLVKISLGGSTIKAMKTFPRYFNEGLKRYSFQFRRRQDHDLSVKKKTYSHG
ncbi:MAG: radical SAM protein [bacterium]